ncbi:hypothetical protein D3C87_1326320 [compost metagenome]
MQFKDLNGGRPLFFAIFQRIVDQVDQNLPDLFTICSYKGGMGILILKREFNVSFMGPVFQSLHHFFGQQHKVELFIVDGDLPGFQLRNGIKVGNQVAQAFYIFFGLIQEFCCHFRIIGQAVL